MFRLFEDIFIVRFSAARTLVVRLKSLFSSQFSRIRYAPDAHVECKDCKFVFFVLIAALFKAHCGGMRFVCLPFPQRCKAWKFAKATLAGGAKAAKFVRKYSY